MKKLLTLALTAILCLGVMAMTACSGGGGLLGGILGGEEKSELVKAFEAIDNCTIETVGISEYHKDYMEYKFTSNKVELNAAAGTKWWDATNTSDYVLLERSYETNYILRVEHKSKTEYETGRKDTFDLLFGYIAKHEDKLTKTESGLYRTGEEPIVHTVSGVAITYEDVRIWTENGKITFAEYTLIMLDTTVYIEVEVGSTSITLPEYIRN